MPSGGRSVRISGGSIFIPGFIRSVKNSQFLVVKFLALKIGKCLINSFSWGLGNVPLDRNRPHSSFRLSLKLPKIEGADEGINSERISTALGDLIKKNESSKKKKLNFLNNSSYYPR
jgi:hypothetical protein